MIVKATCQKEWQALMQFLNHHAHVQPSADMEHIGWVVEEQLQMVVGLSAFLGSTCQIHVAMEPDFKFTPKEMLRQVFHHAFVTKKRRLILGIVNSRNQAAMVYDTHLGFNEMWRIPRMHDENGDIVVMGMHRYECRFLEENKEKAA